MSRRWESFYWPLLAATLFLALWHTSVILSHTRIFHVSPGRADLRIELGGAAAARHFPGGASAGAGRTAHRPRHRLAGGSGGRDDRGRFWTRLFDYRLAQRR